jgi:hypothetical protein
MVNDAFDQSPRIQWASSNLSNSLFASSCDNRRPIIAFGKFRLKPSAEDGLIPSYGPVDGVGFEGAWGVALADNCEKRRFASSTWVA